MGLGRSYGDAFMNSKGWVLGLHRLNKFVDFDPTSGLLRCEGGLPLSDIIDVLAPRGWFVPVTPGTRFVTVGGMIASDVHGKNHHRKSSFSRHLKSMRILLANGEIVECSRQTSQDLFRGTVGGMGLTGLILEAEFQLMKVPSRFIQDVRFRTKNLEQCLDSFESLDPQHEYTVAWLDCASRGQNFARGIFMAGSHLDAEDLVGASHPSGRRREMGIPSGVTLPLITSHSISVFNAIYYSLAGGESRVSPVEDYFYPLDSVHNWNRLYGRGGFLQYQFVVPRGGLEGVSSVLDAVADSNFRPYLSVLKEFGEQDGLLSFPMEGYTLALDFPIREGIFRFLDSLDRIVIDHGGRVYLAKDCRVSRENFSAMYPQVERWLDIKDKFDPHGVLESNLSRRLGLSRP